MKIKTTELSGAGLDWAVAKAVGQHVSLTMCFASSGSKVVPWVHDDFRQYEPSARWDQCGPLIEEYVMCIVQSGTHTWMAECEGYQCVGPTPLIAACRAIVAAELGEEVEIPEGLA